MAAPDRLLISFDQGRFSAMLARSDDLPDTVGTPFDLSWPLDGEQLEDLRWYLEDYLRNPYAVYAERGEKISQQLTDWGEAIFDSLFGVGALRDALVAARSAGRRVEVVLRSADPGWLGLPWELAKDSGRRHLSLWTGPVGFWFVWSRRPAITRHPGRGLAVWRCR